MHCTTRKAWISLLVLFTAGSVFAASYTWDDGEAANHNWSSPNNWNPDAVPASTDVVSFTDSAVGTSIVDQNSSVAGMLFDNSTGQFDLQIQNGITLTVANYLRVGSSTPATSSAKISGSGGILALQGDLQVSGTNSGSLVMEVCTLDSASLNDVIVGDYGAGTVIMSNAVVKSGSDANTLTIGGVLDLYDAGVGALYLPVSMTNMQVSGNFQAYGSGSLLHFGPSPQLDELTFLGNVAQDESSDVRYADTNGLPPGIILNVGQNGSPVTMQIGRESKIDTRWGDLTRFDAYLDTLSLGIRRRSFGRGELDLEGAKVVTDGREDSFTCPTMNIGSVYTKYGELVLDASVTNVAATNLLIRGQGSIGNSYEAYLTFGSNSQDVTLFVSESLSFPGRGNIRWTDSAGNRQTGVPPGTVFKVGSSLSNRGTLDMSGAGNAGTWTVSLGTNTATFEAYLDALTVATHAGSRGATYAVLDLRATTNVTLDVSGLTRIGYGQKAHGDMYLADTDVTFGDLEVGVWSADAYANSGELELSNTLAVVTNDVTIGRKGKIRVYVDQRASGIDLQTESLNINTDATSFGQIDLRFLSDATNNNENYWGLRMLGDQTTLFSEWTGTPTRLTWNTNGLSAGAANRFGIYYDLANNQTYVGVESLGAANRPKIFNEDATNVTTSSAFMNGFLESTGTLSTTVSIYWGDADGGSPASGSWQKTNSWPAGTWGAGSYPWFSTNNLSADETYYYRYYAINTAGANFPADSTNFITGEVTIKATANAKEGWYDGEFTVYRPSGCTDEDIPVHYSIDTGVANAATYGTEDDYTLSPSGTVVIAAGQTSAVIEVSVFYDADTGEPTENITLDLEPGRYAIGSPSSANVQIENAVLPNACRLDTEGLRNLEVGTYGNGVMDISGALVQSGTATNMLTVGGNLDLYGSGQGVLRLPFAITNIDVDGDFQMYGPSCQLDFGFLPELETFTVRGNAYHDRGSTMLYDNGVSTGLPPNITINIGTATNPADLRIGYGQGYIIRWANMARFNAYLDSLEVGPSEGSFGYGELDLRSAQVVTDGKPDSLLAASVRVEGNYSKYAKLLLPAAITNFSVGNLTMGVTPWGGTTGAVVFASNSQLRVFEVTNAFTIDRKGTLAYIATNGATVNGLPPSQPIVRLGVSAANRGTMDWGISDTHGWSTTLGTNTAAFTAYLDSLTLAQGANSSGHKTVDVDLRNASNVALDVSGLARIGYGIYAHGSLYLKDAEATAGQLELGIWTKNAYVPSGELWLSNTVFVCTNGATIGRKGVVTTYITGQSAGLDVQSGTLSVAESNATVYGQVSLNFVTDALTKRDYPYWGLRVDGDKVVEILSLTNEPARLTWDTSGLTSTSLERFGVHYDGGRDVTYVGVSPPRGTIILLK